MIPDKNHNAKPLVVACATSYLPFIGGAEIAVENICSRLKDQFDFIIVTARLRRDLPPHEIRPEGTVIRLGMGTRMDSWLLPVLGCIRILRMYRIRKPVLLWGMDISQGALAAALAAFLMPSLRFFLTVQYGESEERLRFGRGGMIWRSFRFLLARADWVSAISTYLIRVVRSAGYDGPATLIPNGADAQWAGSHEVKKDKESAHRAPVIITVSRLVSKNGVDVLIRAFARIHNGVSETRLSIVGDGQERGALERLAESIGIRDAVTFHGAHPPERVREFLHKADVFVRPSRSEGMGNAFVEALAAGLPVIGTLVGGIPDIIDQGVTGLMVPPDDPEALAQAMRSLLDDPALGRRMAERGRRMVGERFSWETIAHSYRTIFELVARARNRILVAAPILAPDIGGPATYAAELIREFPLQKTLVRVARFPRERRMPAGMRHAAYFFRLLGAVRGCSALLALDPISAGLPGLSAAAAAGKPFVLKIGGDYAWEQAVQRFGVGELLDEFLCKRYGFWVEALRIIQSLVGRGAGRVIVPSAYLKGVALRWGVREHRIRVVPNAYDPPSLVHSREEAQRRIGMTGTILVSAGRLVPWKGFRVLIDIVPSILRAVPDARLVIIGSGPDEPALKFRIQSLGLGDRILMRGSVSRDTLMDYLSSADCFLLNSGYEGFSHTILEAMAAGALVIASRAGGNAEIIQDGVNGFLAECDNQKEIIEALRRVLGLDALSRSALLAEARKNAFSYSALRMAEETMCVLREIL